MQNPLIRVFVSIWKKYSEGIKKRCHQLNTDKDGLPYWRKALFTSILIYTFPFSFIALIPGLFLTIKYHLWLLFTADLTAIILLVFIIWFPYLKIGIRKMLFVANLFLLSLVLLLEMGLFGPGMLYMLLCSIIAVLIFDLKFK